MKRASITTASDSQSPTSSSTSNHPSHPSTATSPPQPAKQYSCSLCKQRKVKCDKKTPCAACIKSGAECVPVIPQPPRRGKRKNPFDDSSSGGRARENSTGTGCAGGIIQLPEKKEPKNAKPDWGAQGGRFITRDGNSRYLESNIWTNLTDEFRDKADILRVSSEVQAGDDGSSFLRGAGATPTSENPLSSLHPEAGQVFLLWQKFLDNVNPLSKIIHAPTVQQKIVQATTQPAKMSKPMTALLFGIYFAAAMSMSEEEVQSGLGMEKKVCLAKYRASTERALGEARVLRTLDLTVLQAYIFYLLGIRVSQDSGSFWILCGVAVRIAMRMGLHKDGEKLNLPPFEVEMRRRISSQIRLLDGRASGADASGGPGVSVSKWDSHPPLNVNDADIYPEMTKAPEEHLGLTEMSFVHLRASFGEFLIRKFGGDWSSLWSDPTITFNQKKSAIDELEAQLENKFVRLCNPAVPLHQFITALARAVVSRMRIAALHPRHYKSMPKADRDAVVGACVRMIALDNSVYKNPDAQRYLWHIQVHFQSDALIIVLSEVRRWMGEGEEERERAEVAWVEIEEVYSHHPELMNGSPLHVAIGNLAVKAWDHREAELRKRGIEFTTPKFIQPLRARIKKDGNVTGGVEIEPGVGREDDGPQWSKPFEGVMPTIFGQSSIETGGAGSGTATAGDGVGTDGKGGGSPIYADDALPEAAPIDWSPLEWQYWDELMRNYGVGPGPGP